MEQGTTSPAVTRALNSLYTAVLGFNSSDNRDTALLSEILYQLDQITQARRAKKSVMASGNVPAIIWLGLFGGAFVAIGFTFFFGSENLRARQSQS